MVEATTVTILFVAPAVIGFLISLIELFFVHADENGLGWLMHGLHAVPITIILTYISMNVPWVLSLAFMGWMPSWAGTYAIPIIIGIIATIKVKGAAALAKGGTVGEHMWHAAVVGALIALAPFIYPLIAGLLPAFLAR